MKKYLHIKVDGANPEVDSAATSFLTTDNKDTFIFKLESSAIELSIEEVYNVLNELKKFNQGETDGNK